MARIGGTVLVLAVLGGLAGCGTPLQQCVREAEQTTREIERELSERYANLSRGYSIERVTMPRLVPSICPSPSGAMVPCSRWENDVEEIRHRIDRDLERERIALLERQLERERPRAAAAVAQCRATYPE